MSTSISWIHFTDLHFGQRNEWLWPGMRQQLYEDLKVMIELEGAPDLVFFSGDFVQRGSAQEFKELRYELERLWAHFTTLGSSPLLMCVPGNHDIERPGDTDLLTRQSHRWHDAGEECVREEFWSNSKSSYRKGVDRALKNYTEWLKLLQVPQANVTKGILPGDFSLVLKRDEVRLGVIGLNTTFLQLGGGDYTGKLDLHVQQLHAVCNNDAETWRRSVDFSVLMTHQPPSWLHPQAKGQLSEIYTLGRFDTHLAGHLHDPKMHDSSESGGGVRRLRQGASLFGLERFGISETRPLFGYMMGRWVVNGDGATEVLSPRLAEFARDGVRRLGPDRGYHLDVHNRCVSSFKIKRAENTRLLSGSVHVLSATVSAPLPPPNARPEKQRIVHPEKHLDVDKAKKTSKEVPRARMRAEEQHRAIRSDRFVRMATILRERHIAWLVSDWGLGKDGFLACVIEHLSGNESADVFTLQCGEAENCDDLQELSDTQFGLTFQEFFAAVASLPSAILILDDLPSTFVVGPEQMALNEAVLKPIRDFCPDLRIVLVARQEPRSVDSDDVVVLRPLEVHETRSYLRSHPRVQQGLDDPETLERVQAWSEGLTMRLDQLLEQLQIFSLTEILNEGSDWMVNQLSSIEPIPRALREAVAQLADATGGQARHSFRLLKILTVLRDGEVFQSIRRFYPNEPFYLNNVSELIGLALLEAVPIVQTVAELSAKDGRPTRPSADSPKLLRVPRQVRDYVGALITPEERASILNASTDLFFGKTWRTGDIHLRRGLSESYEGSAIAGPGNEHVVVQHLLFESLNGGDDQQIRRAILLGLNLCKALFDADRFRDAVIASGTMVHVLRETGFQSQYAEAARLHSRSLRMMDYFVGAIEMAKIALEQGSDYYTDASKAAIFLEIALAHESLDQKEEALAAAEKVIDLASAESAFAYQAQAIIAKLTIEEADKQDKRLRFLMGKARSKGYDTVANNITLELVRGGKSARESLKQLETVFETATGNYTRTRAIVQKAALLRDLGRTADLTMRERELLSAAYSYSYGQRIGNLLERCHSVMWEIFAEEGVVATLLRLFRLSSFFWRLRGSQERESRYIRHFDTVDLDELKRVEGRTLDNEIHYLEQRRQEYPTENGVV